jgi:preprotein translocase SecE subunit
MADKPAPSASDSNDAPKRKRRVLRPVTEPSTLREKSEQAQAKSDKPARFGSQRLALGAPFRFVGRLFRPLGRFRLIRAVGYIVFPPYFRNSWKELRLVTWPNRTQTRRLTFAVIIFSLIFGGIVAAVDWGFDKAFRELVLKK